MRYFFFPTKNALLKRKKLSSVYFCLSLRCLVHASCCELVKGQMKLGQQNFLFVSSSTSILQVYKNSLLGASLGFRPSYRPSRTIFNFPPFLFKCAPGTSAVEDPHAHPEVRLRHLLAGTNYHICVLILLYMCPRTSKSVSAYYFVCPHICRNTRTHFRISRATRTSSY